MEIRSDIAGLQSKPLDIVLSPRQCMNYAAGVRDTNPAYFDDTRDEGIVAPPMLSAALTWPLTERYVEFWGDRAPLEIMRRQVHFTERLRWHRPMRPGDALRIRGELVGVTPHLAGTLITALYTAVDPAGGLVFEEYCGGLLRGVHCVGGGKRILPLDETPRLPRDTGVAWECALDIGPLDAHVYDACSGIAFPVHTSPRFARSVGLPDPIYHGTATLSLVLREVLDRFADGKPARLTAARCRFLGMVMPGSSILLRAFLPEADAETRTVFFDVLSPDQRRPLADGSAQLGPACKTA